MGLFSDHRSSQYHPKSSGTSGGATSTGDTGELPYLQLTDMRAAHIGNSAVRSQRSRGFSKALTTSCRPDTRSSADSTSKQTCASSHFQATPAKATEPGPICGASKVSCLRGLVDYFATLLVAVGAMSTVLLVVLYQAGFFHYLAKTSPENRFLNFLFGA